KFGYLAASSMLNAIEAPGPESSTLGPVQAPEWVKENKSGGRKLEYLGASRIPNTIVAPRPSSFTSVPIHALKALKENQLEGQWSVQELLDKIRLQTSDSSTSQLLVQKSEYKSPGHITSSRSRKTGTEEGSQRTLKQIHERSDQLSSLAPSASGATGWRESKEQLTAVPELPFKR
ncbi:MAG: hypothetical protein Q9205_008063, partial [Flavoplaca limonia]